MPNPILSILIPNYNRPECLKRLLTSIYQAIEYAQASEYALVIVVDDYSTVEIQSHIRNFFNYRNFVFKSQINKCGNAERAFLSSIEYIGTKYTWLLGNDDYVSRDALKILLPILKSDEYGFILLNPYINKISINQSISPILALSESVIYKKCHDIFMDFGFVTSTTTFSCIIFKTEPVRDFHYHNKLCDVANVYSHTFTLYSALHDHKALFISDRIVSFTLNERIEEQEKLERQAPNRISFFHQSLGLCKLIDACSAATGVPIKTLARATEDEVDKDRLTVQTTTLIHFATFFFIEQLIREQENIFNSKYNFGYLSKSEMVFIASILIQSESSDIKHIVENVLILYNNLKIDPLWKRDYYRVTQSEVLTLGRKAYLQSSVQLEPGRAKKIFPATFEIHTLRGAPGDILGEEQVGVLPQQTHLVNLKMLP